MKAVQIALVLGWTMFISLASVSATTVLPMDLRDLTSDAEVIFIGTVTDIRSEKDLHTIYTYVTFSDLRVLKGSYLGDAIEVRLSGGTVAGQTMQVSGMPSFVVGETSLIFLAGNSELVCPIVGWTQGRFKVRWDKGSGQEVVVDDSDVPVTEIRGREIVRTKKTKRPKGSPGVPDTGETGEALAPELQKEELEARVSLESFISAIETTMGVGSQLPGNGKERRR